MKLYLFKRKKIVLLNRNTIIAELQCQTSRQTKLICYSKDNVEPRALNRTITKIKLNKKLGDKINLIKTRPLHKIVFEPKSKFKHPPVENVLFGV